MGQCCCCMCICCGANTKSPPPMVYVPDSEDDYDVKQWTTFWKVFRDHGFHKKGNGRGHVILEHFSGEFYLEVGRGCTLTNASGEVLHTQPYFIAHCCACIPYSSEYEVYTWARDSLDAQIHETLDSCAVPRPPYINFWHKDALKRKLLPKVKKQMLLVLLCEV